MIIRLSIAPDSLDHISFVEVVCSDQDKADVVQVARKLGHRIIHSLFDPRQELSKILHFKIEQVGSSLCPDSQLDVESFKNLADSFRAITAQTLNHTSARTPEGRIAIRRQFLIIDGELVKFATMRVKRTPNPDDILYQCREYEGTMEFLSELPQPPLK